MKKLIVSIIAAIASVSTIHAHCGTCSGDGAKADHHHGEEIACSSAQLAPYFEAQSALASDDLPTAQASAAKLVALAKEKGCSLDGKSCCSAEIEAATNIVDAKDIAAARNAFKAWSDTLIGKLDSDHKGEGDLYKMHCPMAFGNKGGSWLQSSKDLRNPYYGAMMLKCGTVQKDYAKGESSHTSGGHGHHH